MAEAPRATMRRDLRANMTALAIGLGGGSWMTVSVLGRDADVLRQLF